MSDVLLVHTGPGLSERPRLGGWPQAVSTPLFPLGWFYMADHLERKGYSCRILNLFLIDTKDHWSYLKRCIRQHLPRILGLDLHWHQQSYAVLTLAARIKLEFPDILIVLGGHMASAFQLEVLAGHPAVDVVVRGDGEKPLARLLAGLLRNEKCPFPVPGVAWRRKGRIVNYPAEDASSRRVIASGTYPRFDFLLHDKDSLLYLTGEICGESQSKIMILNPTRGCSGGCLYCGAGHEGQKKLFQRRQMTCTSLDHAFKSLRVMQKEGIEIVYFIAPHKRFEGFYRQLFSRARRERIRLRAYVECFYLPSPSFIEQISKTFGKGFVVILSPDTGSDSLRRRVRPGAYSGDALEKTIERVRAAGGDVKLFFTTGLPFETRKDFLLTMLRMRQWGQRYRVMLEAQPVALEPYSPMFLHPESKHVHIRWRTLKDFLRASRRENGEIGYSTDYFSEGEILRNAQTLNALAERHGYRSKQRQ